MRRLIMPLQPRHYPHLCGARLGAKRQSQISLTSSGRAVSSLTGFIKPEFSCQRRDAAGTFDSRSYGHGCAPALKSRR